MISIVIPTYNEEKNIERCLESLINQTINRDHIEIIVVDGESQDSTREIAGKIADKVIIQSGEGVGGARNDGFKLAKNDLVATTDADCVPHANWIESILRSFEEDNVVAVTGVLKPFDWIGMNWLSIMIYRILFKISNFLLIIMTLFGHYHLCGANSAFNKKVFLEIGGYLPLAYADDVEIFKRIKKKGDVKLTRDMKVNYSVRRIKKIGLMKYFYLILKMDTEIMLLGRKPMKGNYARIDYE
jgi:glycosyltransferase involved in cell wall biosynthesis